MKTSNFTISGTHPNAVAIVRYFPRGGGFKGRLYQDLAPSAWLLKAFKEGDHAGDVAWWTAQFKAQLAKLDAKKVLADLGEDAILLCYERPGEFCHRRLVAEWLKEQLGIDVPELSTCTHSPDWSAEKPFSIVGLSNKAKLPDLSAIHLDDAFALERDAANPYDSNAIRVIHARTGKWLGFIPRDIAAILAPRLDGGEALHLKLVTKKLGASTRASTIEVRLHDGSVPVASCAGAPPKHQLSMF